MSEQPLPPTSEEPRPKNWSEAFLVFTGPVVLISLCILFSVFVLIGASLFGYDKGRVLENLADTKYARGLITYLFAIGTIGSVVVLIVAALSGSGPAGERFNRAKEVFSLLIGLFGTIIGFYFGSQAGEVRRPELEILEPNLPEKVKTGDSVPFITFVRGGVPPYHFTIRYGDKTSPASVEGTSSGWIQTNLTVKIEPGQKTIPFQLEVRDSQGIHASKIAEIRIE
jgi:hypothetical protein